MADVVVGLNKVITIPAGADTRLVFKSAIQHISFINESNTDLFFRADNVAAVIDDAECNRTLTTAGISGFENLYFNNPTRYINMISATETVIQIFNIY